ncbi:hypothetical protein CKO28_00695 [Rhodovibrio sodomensis]|uniref:Uncharacterized protein n=1 Tax=Rhodovibrio sodomensis TaxID=1088 RepID=A0ABS1D960_9PROT|nr:hypothetical protein [Rhodovibrio sodomensis]MBK1666559.1 hypothetical protein [Rhodovibrio sodomensis]
MKHIHAVFPDHLLDPAREAYDRLKRGEELDASLRARVAFQYRDPIDTKHEICVAVRLAQPHYSSQDYTDIGISQIIWELDHETGLLELVVAWYWSIDPKIHPFDGLLSAIDFAQEPVTVRVAPDRARLSVPAANLTAPRLKVMAKHRHYEFADLRVRRLRGNRGTGDRFTVEVQLLNGANLATEPMPIDRLPGTHTFTISLNRTLSVEVAIDDAPGGDESTATRVAGAA